MHKREVAAEVARRTSLTQKQTSQVLDAILEVITEAMIANDPVTLVGFGRFELRVYTGRSVPGFVGQGPSLTESRPRPVFHPYPLLKQRVREEADLASLLAARARKKKRGRPGSWEDG